MSESAYTEEELKELKRYKDIRNNIIDKLIEEGKDKSRLMCDLLTSAEKSVHDTVNNRLKQKENDNKEAILLQVATALKLAHKEMIDANKKLQPLNKTIESKYIDTNVVEGELEIQPAKLDPNDFLPKDEE